jgi:hypothetical protein
LQKVIWFMLRGCRLQVFKMDPSGVTSEKTSGVRQIYKIIYSRSLRRMQTRL